MSDKVLSKELSAMVAIEQALEPLSEEERSRVLAWSAARFGVVVSVNSRAPSSKAATDTDSNDGDHSRDEPASKPATAETLAEFYDSAAPNTEADKALVVAYWFQFHEGQTELEAQTLNSNLKHLGHGIGNITRALEWHKSQKPALLVQLRKEGTTKQARKKFKVTNEGKKFVERMLNHG